MSQVSYKDLNIIKAKQSQQRYLSDRQQENEQFKSTGHMFGSESHLNSEIKNNKNTNNQKYNFYETNINQFDKNGKNEKKYRRTFDVQKNSENSYKHGQFNNIQKIGTQSNSHQNNNNNNNKLQYKNSASEIFAKSSGSTIFKETKSYQGKKVPQYSQSLENKLKQINLENQKNQYYVNLQHQQQNQEQQPYQQNQQNDVNSNQYSNDNSQLDYILQENSSRYQNFNSNNNINIQQSNEEGDGKFVENYFRICQSQYVADKDQSSSSRKQKKNSNKNSSPSTNRNQNGNSSPNSRQNQNQNAYSIPQDNNKFQAKQDNLNWVIEEQKYDSSPEKMIHEKSSKKDFNIKLGKKEEEQYTDFIEEKEGDIKKNKYKSKFQRQNFGVEDFKKQQKNQRQKHFYSTDSLSKILDKKNNLFVSKFRLPKVLAEQKHPLNLLGEQEFFLLPDDQQTFKNYKFKRPIFKGTKLDFLMNIPFDQYPKVIVEKNHALSKYELSQQAIEQMRARNIEGIQNEQKFIYQQENYINNTQQNKIDDQNSQNLQRSILRKQLKNINQNGNSSLQNQNQTFLQKMGLKNQFENLNDVSQNQSQLLEQDPFEKADSEFEKQLQIENRQSIDSQIEPHKILQLEKLQDDNQDKNQQKKVSNQKFKSVQNFYTQSSKLQEIKKISNDKLKEKAVNLQTEKMKGQLVESRLQKLDRKSQNIILGKWTDKNLINSNQEKKINFILQNGGFKQFHEDDENVNNNDQIQNLNKSKSVKNNSGNNNFFQVENFYQSLAKLDKIEEQDGNIDSARLNSNSKRQIQNCNSENADQLKNFQNQVIYNKIENNNQKQNIINNWQTPLNKYKDYQKWSNIKREQVFSQNLKRYHFNPVKRTQMTLQEKRTLLESNCPNFLIYNSANILKI